MRKPNYDKFPQVRVPAGAGTAVGGWEAIAERLRGAVARPRGDDGGTRRTVLTVECYPGVDEAAVAEALAARLRPAVTLRAAAALRTPAEIGTLVGPYLGGDDPVFGRMSPLRLPEFFDPARLATLRARVAERAGADELVLVVGVGATLVAEGDVLVYADLPRWEAQLRFRRKETGNLGADNAAAEAGPKYKRAYFVDWRVADRVKRPLLARADWWLDTTERAAPKLAEGDAIRRGLRAAATQPFRVVPFFDPAPWGGQWMKDVCDLDRAVPNYGWCFDCVPEENSLRLDCGGVVLEVPALNLVLAEPAALLGESVRARFGDEFPIRFDFLDTMGGGHLSFQVHPKTEYIREHFGLSYTQDESYYVLDAGPEASVYLGLRDGVDPAAMRRELEAAQAGGPAFPVERYANRWPARAHDHFLIPAGTVHCSGANAMVLEISATPYLFTFKLWDWARLGLDGRPRPIYLEHGLANIAWDRTTAWTQRHLINALTPLGRGDGWSEERTGLHELEFIETRRHRFTGVVPHDTRGTVHVLNLVAGEEAVVESPTGQFAPFVVHYAETFIVPAAVGAYTVRPAGADAGREAMTMQARVRA